MPAAIRPRLDRRQRLAEGLAALAMAARLAPSVASVAAQSLERRAASGPASWMTHPFPSDVRTAEDVVVGRAGPIHLRVYTPAHREAARPAMLYIHGGGWVTGGFESCHWLCGELARRVGTVVASVAYRLAPEHPFPAPLDDCFDAFEHLAERSAALGCDGVMVGGDSAGGNLAAAVALLDARGARRARLQLLIYPALDLTLSLPSHREQRSRLLTHDALASTAAHYLGTTRADDPLASPLHAPDLSLLPRAVIVTAEHDPLRDDGRVYAERLDQAAVPVTYRSCQTGGHGFLSTPRLCRESSAVMEDIAEAIADQLSR